MPIGIGAGTAIAAGISGGAAVAQGVMASKSNNKSAQLQSQAATRAADLEAKAAADALAVEKEQQAYERQQAQAKEQARAPYVALGNNTLGNLASILHVQPPQGGFQMAAPAAASSPAPASTAGSTLSQAPAASSGLSNLASVYQPPTTASTATTSADTVKMIAPSGETAMVPRSMVNKAISEGARLAVGA